MTTPHDPTLLEPLAQLEQRGRRHLRALGRCQAADRALAWALPGAVVVPVAALLARVGFALPWPAVALATALTPAAVAALAYAFTRARQKVTRRDALAVVEQQLGLKDRLTASAALLAAPRRDGFGEAALLEARPWIEQALTRPLAEAPRPRLQAWSRRWPLLPAAVALTVLACWLHQRADGGRSEVELTPVQGPGASAGLPALGAQAGTGRGDAAPPPGGRGGDSTGARPGTPRAAGEPGAEAASPLVSGSGAGTGAAPQAEGAAPRNAARPSPSAAVTAAAATGADGATPPTGAGHPGARDAGRVPPAAGARPNATPPAAGGNDPGDSESAADARSQAAQEAPSQRGAQPPASDRPAPPSRQKPSQDGSRSQGGNDGQGNGKDGGEGQNNGRRQGQEEGPKSGRGFATLLLARPMRDQVQGQTNPGRVTSVLQQGRPLGGPAAASPAQGRGELSDGAAVLPTRASTAQDRALLRDYFARRGEEPGSAPRAADNAVKTSR
ncbi:hypothetical protein [Pelomonas cellulosilytica]|uniref:Uncharacterized protein n=1 Tax=Pelomonas cellulosilytica TaxID=2906762 RepID=A0ABS8Y159_9BURK|nr:hypothetical protein [Pelomonas sp. P8]MCE4557947.1 hypothetical protein [Pelomonas sp. P8]